MKYIIGLTGPTGSGKSSFSLLFKKEGITVIDCDKISHEVTKKDSECLNLLSQNFGQDIVINGKLDRKKLAERAFLNQEKKSELEAIIFPFILNNVLYEIEKSKSNTVLLDAPTLFESGINELCGSVVAVLSDLETRKKRIIKRDNLTEQQAIIRINAGKPDSFYVEKADYILYNNSTEAEFLEQSQKLIKKLLEEIDYE